jgi:hypothetical protein
MFSDLFKIDGSRVHERFDLAFLQNYVDLEAPKDTRRGRHALLWSEAFFAAFHEYEVVLLGQSRKPWMFNL